MADIPFAAAGGIYIPTNTTGVPGIRSFGEMARRAMRVLGVQDDETIKKTAMEGLQRAISIVNMYSTFDFTTSVDTDTTLVADTQEYDLPSDLFAIREVQLVDTGETPTEFRPLRFIDWDQVARLYSQNDSGTTGHWSARDTHKDRKIVLFPAPDGSTADNWKLRVYYHTRIENPPLNDPTVEIAGPEELSEILITYAQYHLLFDNERESTAAWSHKRREFDALLAQFKGSRNRTTPGIMQMRIEGLSAPARHRNRSVIRWGG